jgi:hypothetical protein
LSTVFLAWSKTVVFGEGLSLKLVLFGITQFPLTSVTEMSGIH